jgi:hypothetical protein
VQTQLLGFAPPGDSPILRALKVLAFAGIISNLGATLAYVAWGRTMAWIKAIAQLYNNPNPHPRLLRVRLQLGRVLWFALILEFVAYSTSLTGAIFLLCHIGIHVWATETTLIAGVITPFLMVGTVGLLILSSELISRLLHGVFVMDILRKREDHGTLRRLS